MTYSVMFGSITGLKQPLFATTLAHATAHVTNIYVGNSLYVSVSGFLLPLHTVTRNITNHDTPAAIEKMITPANANMSIIPASLTAGESRRHDLQAQQPCQTRNDMSATNISAHIPKRMFDPYDNPANRHITSPHDTAMSMTTDGVLSSLHMVPPAAGAAPPRASTTAPPLNDTRMYIII